MGRRYQQVAGVLLIALLGLGPAVAAVCQASCPQSPAAAAADSNATAVAVHHHQTAAADASQAAEHDASVHQHHREQAPADALATEIDALIEGLASHGCCAQLAPAPSATAARAHAKLIVSASALLVPQPAAAVSAALTDSRVGSPPGRASSPRTPLVLRI